MSNFKWRPDAVEEHDGGDAAPPVYAEPGDDAYAQTGDDASAYAETETWDAEEAETGEHDALDPEDAARPRIGARLGEFRGRVTRALANFDRGYVQQTTPAGPLRLPPPAEPAATEAFDVLADVPEAPARFPTAPLGYNRAAVDTQISTLERELEELRSQLPQRDPAISITEEIERLGEQTASILVVAHDQAHETTRLAQEQAERCVADAAENAVAITAEAKRRLEALDMETDMVWQERARLLEDARATGQALIALIDEADARLPEELKPEPSAPTPS